MRGQAVYVSAISITRVSTSRPQKYDSYSEERIKSCTDSINIVNIKKLLILMIVSAGCTGWGTDGPATQNGSNDTTDRQNASNESNNSDDLETNTTESNDSTDSEGDTQPTSSSPEDSGEESDDAIQAHRARVHPRPLTQRTHRSNPHHLPRPRRLPLLPALPLTTAIPAATAIVNRLRAAQTNLHLDREARAGTTLSHLKTGVTTVMIAHLHQTMIRLLRQMMMIQLLRQTRITTAMTSPIKKKHKRFTIVTKGIHTA